MRKFVNGELMDVVAPEPTKDIAREKEKAIARKKEEARTKAYAQTAVKTAVGVPDFVGDLTVEMAKEIAKQAGRSDILKATLASLESTEGKTAPINHKVEDKVRNINADKIDQLPQAIYKTPFGTVKRDAFVDVADLETITSRDLFRLKNKDLEAIARGLEVSISGRKADKVHNIMVGLSDYQEKVTHIDNTVNIEGAKAVSDYMFSNHLHEILCYKMIVKMATKGFPVKDKDGKITAWKPYRCKEGCSILLKNSIDPLWNDCRQAVAMTLWENVTDITIVDGWLHFPDGKIWNACQRAISHVFSKQRLNSDQIKSPSFSAGIDEHGNYIIAGLTKAEETKYIKAITTECGTLEEIANNTYVVDFFKWVKTTKKYGKHTENMMHVFSARIEGLTKLETCAKYSISKHLFDDSLTRIKSAYTEYSAEHGSLVGEDVASSNKKIGCTYRKSDDSASGSYGFCYNW